MNILLNKLFVFRPEDKKSISSDDSKSTSSSSLLSLTSKSTDSTNSKSVLPAKSLLETEIKETDIEPPQDAIIVANVTSPGHVMSQSMFTDSGRLNEPRLSTKSDEGPRFNLGPSVEMLKRQRSSPEKTDSKRSSASDDITSMDTVLAEIMSDVRSLEMQQSTDKRMSLPLKSKQASKHTPDLVLDLPEGSNSSSPQDGSDRDSPTLSAAETFAKSNQGTLKKASSMPRNVSGSDIYTAEFKPDQNVHKPGGTMVSTFQTKRHDPLTSSSSVSSSGRKYSLEEHHLKSLSLPSTQVQTFSPPIAERPKPPIKVKPPVMKKPTTRSPDTSRRLETNLDNVSTKSNSPSTFK